MNDSSAFQSDLVQAGPGNLHLARKSGLLLSIDTRRPAHHPDRDRRRGSRSIKAPLPKTSNRLIESGIIREEVLENKGQGRNPRVLSFVDEHDYFIGVNLGVRSSQVGMTTSRGEITDEDTYETPNDPAAALRKARERIEKLYRQKHEGRRLRVIGVSVPGMTDSDRTAGLFTRRISAGETCAIADALQIDKDIPVVVENDATAAAMYEARLKIRNSENGLMTNFILVRSGTGIGVGLVIGSEVYRGTGVGPRHRRRVRAYDDRRGRQVLRLRQPRLLGKIRVGLLRRIALYGRPAAEKGNETLPRFVEIVTKAENGDIRSRKTLEKIGDYLGIGIANVIMGVGIPRVIISGRLVYGWQFIREPLNQAIRRSIVGKIEGWSVEAGEPAGAAIGGALEVAVEEYLSTV